MARNDSYVISVVTFVMAAKCQNNGIAFFRSASWQFIVLICYLMFSFLTLAAIGQLDNYMMCVNSAFIPIYNTIP